MVVDISSRQLSQTRLSHTLVSPVVIQVSFVSCVVKGGGTDPTRERRLEDNGNQSRVSPRTTKITIVPIIVEEGSN